MTNYRRYKLKSLAGHCGVTLVELMVAITVSLILLGGVVQIYSGSKTAYRMTENLSRLQENGRFAMEFLSRDIRMAGFWGCLGDLTNVTNNLAATGGGYNFAASIAGTNGAGSAADSITIGAATGAGATVVLPFMPNAAAALHLNTGNGLAVDDIVLVSDCTGGDIFQITGPQDPDSTGTLNHNPGAGTPGNSTGGLSKTYRGDARLYSARSVAYTIATGLNGQNALFRNGNEAVENVENMQILYGEDTDADGVANRYVPAGTPNMDNVVSVRVALLLQSTDSVLPQSATQNHTLLDVTVSPTDQRLRRVFSTTITLRNRAP